VPDDAVFLKEIVEDNAEAEVLEFAKVDGDGFGALGAVAAGDIGRDGLTIGDDPIDHPARDVFLDGAEMIGESVTGSLAGLGHEIGDIDARRFGLDDGGSNFRDKEIGKDAGVKRTGAEQNEVGLRDGFEGFGNGTDAARRERELFNGLAAGGDARFPLDAAAILESGHERNVGNGRWKDAATDGEHFTADADGFAKVAGDVRERGEKKIAKVVANEAAPGMEAILKEAGEESFVFGKRHHAVANVAWRENAILAAKTTGTAAIIGDGDDGGEIGDGALGSGMLVAAANDVFFQSTQDGGKARAPTEGHDAEAVGESVRSGGAFFHVSFSEPCGSILQKSVRCRIQGAAVLGERRVYPAL
jgi:hypothetical protein